MAVRDTQRLDIRVMLGEVPLRNSCKLRIGRSIWTFTRDRESVGEPMGA